jgi:hypothetical protein
MQARVTRQSLPETFARTRRCMRLWTTAAAQRDSSNGIAQSGPRSRRYRFQM